MKLFQYFLQRYCTPLRSLWIHGWMHLGLFLVKREPRSLPSHALVPDRVP